MDKQQVGSFNNATTVDNFSNNEFVEFYSQMAASAVPTSQAIVAAAASAGLISTEVSSGSFISMQPPTDVQAGSAVTVVTPSQAAVAQARSQLVNNAAERAKPLRSHQSRKRKATGVAAGVAKSRRKTSSSAKAKNRPTAGKKSKTTAKRAAKSRPKKGTSVARKQGRAKKISKKNLES